MLSSAAVAALLAMPFVLAAARPVHAAEDWTVHVTMSAAARSVGDDEGAFAERHRVAAEPAGGIEDLRIERHFKRDRTLRLRGRAIFDEGDYLLRLDFNAPDEGYVRAGYRAFRTWSDATGGYFPQGGGVFLPVLGEDFTLDRSEAWLEAGLRGKLLSAIDLRYRHRERDGRKPSLVWGDTTNTGGFGARSIVPSFWDLDEKTDTIELEVADRIKRTRVRGRLRYESIDTQNSRNSRRNPEETGLDRFVTQRGSQDAELFGAHAATETKFKRGRVVLTTGYSFTNVHNEIGGSRIYGDHFGAAFSPTFPNRQFFEREVLNVAGDTNLRLHLGNVNLMLRPARALALTGAVRFGQEDRHGSDDIFEAFLDFRATPPLVEAVLSAHSRSRRRQLLTSLDARYTGIAGTVVYAEAEWEQTDGSLFERLIENDATSIERDTDLDRDAQRLTVGLTWYPAKPLSLTSRYRYSRRKNDYDHTLDSTDNAAGGDRYPAFLLSNRIEQSDFNVRATWRASSAFTLVGRYDFDRMTVDTRAATLGEVESASVTRHVLGASASWNPLASVYLQANSVYSLAETDTPADELAGTTGQLVPDFDNDFWTADLLGGWAIDDSTDLSARYYFYRADNYSDNSAVSQPFGADAEEHGILLEVSRRLTEAARLRAAYGFVKSNDDESGGRDDYQAHLASAAVELEF